MADNLKYEYKRHIHDTAPDMDKLWNRIESRIDSNTDKTDTNIAHGKNIAQTKKSYFWIVTAAAAVFAFAAGTKAFGNFNNPDKNKTDNTDSSYTADKNDTAANVPPADADEATAIRYSELSLSPTSTMAYKSYEADGDEYFVEENVLAQTEYFADVKVLSASLNTYGADYELEIQGFYSRDGEKISGSITLESSTPYILQENREYLLPLARDGEDWHITFENAPQIEITLDGGAVFHNGWDSLGENSRTVDKAELGQNDFYYDRMKYCDQKDLQGFIESWQEA